MIDEYFEAVNKLLKELIKSDAKTDEIKRKLRRLSLKYPQLINFAELQSIVSESEFKAKFLDLAENLKADANKITAPAINSNIVREIIKQRNAGNSYDEILKGVKKIENIANRHVNTLTNTIDGAISQSITNQNAIDGGAKRARYSGSAVNARPKCLEWLNKEFTIEEIKNLDNNQGLDVLHFCGGYNCKHFWVWIVDK